MLQIEYIGDFKLDKINYPYYNKTKKGNNLSKN